MSAETKKTKAWGSGYVVGSCCETDFCSNRIEPIGILKFFGEGPSDNHVNVAEVDDGGVEENFVYRFSIRRFEFRTIEVIYVFAGQGKPRLDYGLCYRIDIEEDCPQASRQLFSESRFSGGGRPTNYVQRWHFSPFIPRSTQGAADFAEPAIPGKWNILGRLGRQW